MGFKFHKKAAQPSQVPVAVETAPKPTPAAPIAEPTPPPVVVAPTPAPEAPPEVQSTTLADIASPYVKPEAPTAPAAPTVTAPTLVQPATPASTTAPVQKTPAPTQKVKGGQKTTTTVVKDLSALSSVAVVPATATTVPVVTTTSTSELNLLKDEHTAVVTVVKNNFVGISNKAFPLRPAIVFDGITVHTGDIVTFRTSQKTSYITDVIATVEVPQLNVSPDTTTMTMSDLLVEIATGTTMEQLQDRFGEFVSADFVGGNQVVVFNR